MLDEVRVKPAREGALRSKRSPGALRPRDASVFGFTLAAPGPRVVAYLKRQKAREASVSGAYGVIRVDDASYPYLPR